MKFPRPILIIVTGLLMALTVSRPAAMDGFGRSAEVKPTQVQAASPTPSLAGLETDEFRLLRGEGYVDLYNMDYSSAKAKFQALVRLQPDHPAGSLDQATTLWLEILNSHRRLRTNLFAGMSFFAKTDEKVDPVSDKAFRTLIANALKHAVAASAKNPTDSEALYYQGLAHGLLASYETTVARSFFSALHNGLQSFNLHRKLLERDPTFIDAHLTTGTYNYIVGSLPFFVKVLAAIGGYHGSREEGLNELQLVAEKGRYARDDAKVALVTFYSREKRSADVLRLLEDLSTRYPRNYIFRLEKAEVLITLGRSQESRGIFDTMLADPKCRGAADLVRFQYGEALFAQGNFFEALQQFHQAITTPEASTELVVRSHLRAGHALDLLKRRPEAIQEYKLVLKLVNVFDSHEQAEKYLDEPYRRRE